MHLLRFLTVNSTMISSFAANNRTNVVDLEKIPQSKIIFADSVHALSHVSIFTENQTIARKNISGQMLSYASRYDTAMHSPHLI